MNISSFKFTVYSNNKDEKCYNMWLLLYKD